MKTNERVNLRDPSDYTKIIGTVKKGTNVYFTGKTTKAFYLVQTSSGKQGYVFKMYLDDVNVTSKSSVYKVKTDTKLYKSASTDAKTVCKLKAGRYVQVSATQDGWAYALTTNGKKGYIKTSDLTK